MTTEAKWVANFNNFRQARRSVDVSVGESVRIIRELQDLSRTALAGLAGTPPSAISAIENNRVNPVVERTQGGLPWQESRDRPVAVEVVVDPPPVKLYTLTRKRIRHTIDTPTELSR